MVTNEEAIGTVSSAKPPITGSPIIIGGGGGGEGGGEGGALENKIPNPVFCEFDEAVYEDPEPQGNPRRKRFENRGLQIRSMVVNINGDTIDLSMFLRQTRGTVDVRCPGSNNDLRIFGNPLGIEFHTGTYEQELGTHKHKSRNSFPSMLEINFDGLNIERPLTGQDNWFIKVNYVRAAE